jgi:hypothetical protein
MLVAAFASAIVAAHAQTTPADSADLTPREIFVKAFQRLQTYFVPPYSIDASTWHIRGSSLGGDALGEADYTYRYAIRTSDGMENYTKYPVPGPKLPNATIVAPSSFLGPFAWALHPARPSPEPQSMQPDIPPSLKTIASVIAYNPSYTITLVGHESIDRHDTYHLHLHPIGNPSKHNLRDLWVDVATFDLWKSRFVGVWQPGGAETLVTASFMPAARSWIVKQAEWSYGCGGMSTGTCTYDLLKDRVVFLPSLPDWVFNEREYRQHVNAGETDFMQQFLSN